MLTTTTNDLRRVITVLGPDVHLSSSLHPRIVAGYSKADHYSKADRYSKADLPEAVSADILSPDPIADEALLARLRAQLARRSVA